MYHYKYLVTKMFISGILKGITLTEKTTIEFGVGQIYRDGTARGRYRVLECKEI